MTRHFCDECGEETAAGTMQAVGIIVTAPGPESASVIDGRVLQLLGYHAITALRAVCPSCRPRVKARLLGRTGEAEVTRQRFWSRPPPREAAREAVIAEVRRHVDRCPDIGAPLKAALRRLDRIEAKERRQVQKSMKALFDGLLTEEHTFLRKEIATARKPANHPRTWRPNGS